MIIHSWEEISFELDITERYNAAQVLPGHSRMRVPRGRVLCLDG